MQVFVSFKEVMPHWCALPAKWMLQRCVSWFFGMKINESFLVVLVFFEGVSYCQYSMNPCWLLMAVLSMNWLKGWELSQWSFVGFSWMFSLLVIWLLCFSKIRFRWWNLTAFGEDHPDIQDIHHSFHVFLLSSMNPEGACKSLALSSVTLC